MDILHCSSITVETRGQKGILLIVRNKNFFKQILEYFQKSQIHVIESKKLKKK